MNNSISLLKRASDYCYDTCWITEDVHVGIIQRRGFASISVHWDKEKWAWIGLMGPGHTPQVVFPHQYPGVMRKGKSIPDGDRHKYLAPLNDPYHRDSPPQRQNGSLALAWGFFTVTHLEDIGRMIQVDLPNYQGHIEIKLYRGDTQPDVWAYMEGQHQVLPIIVLSSTAPADPPISTDSTNPA